MKTTIRDVASAAGVSPASVSLVLNNKPSRISARTKQRILDAADQLGYLADVSQAETGHRAQTRIIGIILPGSTEFSAEYLPGIENYAGVYGFRTVSCDLGTTTEKCLSYIDFLWNLGVDGIILMPPDDMNQGDNNLRLGEALHAPGRPFVLLSRAIYRVFTDFITSDLKAGAYTATEYLIRRGHRRIGLLSGIPGIYNTRKKREGYSEALRFYGLPLDEELIYTGDHTAGSGSEAAAYFVERGVTAILSMNDWMAFGVYRYAGEHRLEIGEDLSLIGFHNSPFCDFLRPALTSIGEEYDLMGRKACERLIARITGEDSDGPRNSYFVPTLVERGSVKRL